MICLKDMYWQCQSHNQTTPTVGNFELELLPCLCNKVFLLKEDSLALELQFFILCYEGDRV